MIELLKLFAWSLPAGAVCAAALALLGAHLAARDRAMQTVCVSQGAMLGVILALGVSGPLDHDTTLGHLVPLFAAAGSSVATYFLTDWIALRSTVSKNTLFASVFALLLAAGYLVSALFPALENHMTQIYFGDLATLLVHDAQAAVGIGGMAILILGVGWKTYSNQSFELAVFGELSRGKGMGFNFVALTLLCYSVQTLGFLFTIAMLFLPTTLLAHLRKSGLRRHLWMIAISSSVSAFVGFLLSLSLTRLPTVPSIVLVQFLLSSLFLAGERLFASRKAV